MCYNKAMKLKAYAKVNLILNVLGKRPDGYHEVLMLMQAISLADIVSVEAAPRERATTTRQSRSIESSGNALLTPADFEYGEKDLAWKAALLMAESFAPELLEKGNEAKRPGNLEGTGIRGISISIEKHIPAAAGLAGGSADAAAVLIGLAKLLGIAGENAAESSSAHADTINNTLLGMLLPLGAQLGSDVPFCIASQLGHPAAIASGRGTQLEFVEPTDCGVDLYFSDTVIPNKTAAVYRELKPEDCNPVYDIRAFLAAQALTEKRALMGNHLQAPAERLIGKSSNLMLCGAGPTYFTIGEEGQFRTILK